MPNYIKKGEGKVPVGKGKEMPMNFAKRDARKQRVATNKGRLNTYHNARDNTKHRR